MNSRNRLCEIQQMVYIRFTIPVRSLSRSKVQFLAGGLCEAVSSRLSSSRPFRGSRWPGIFKRARHRIGEVGVPQRRSCCRRRTRYASDSPLRLPPARGLTAPPSPRRARCVRISLETEPRRPRPECRGRTVPRAIAVIEELYFF